MTVQKTISGMIMLAAALSAAPAMAETITTPFVFDWNGIPLGNATLNYENNGNSYNASLDGTANGFSKIFVKMTTQTTSSGALNGTTVTPKRYDSAYQLKNKNKEVHLQWDGKSKLTRDEIIPATDREKRPEVSSARKTGTMDALSAFWQMQNWLAPGSKLANAGATQDIKIWDGKRLFDLNVTNLRTVPWQEGTKKMNATKLRFRRTGLAGFTPEEQQSLEASQGKEFYLYFCAEDSLNCSAREPLGMEMPVLLGTLRASKLSATAAPVGAVQSTPMEPLISPQMQEQMMKLLNPETK